MSSDFKNMYSRHNIVRAKDASARNVCFILLGICGVLFMIFSATGKYHHIITNPVAKLTIPVIRYNTLSKTTGAEICRQLDLISNGSDQHGIFKGGKLDVGLNKINISTVEKIVFGNQTTEVRRLLLRVNGLLQNHTQSGRIPGIVTQGKSGLLIGNYTYFPGGHWRPALCRPVYRVAVIIPFRNRSDNLNVLFRYLTLLMQYQELEFRLIVVEQANMLPFNKAMLMNIGVVESEKIAEWDCFIFHDVDQIPINVLNYYGCKGMPRHFSFNKSLPFQSYMYTNLCGVVGFTRSQLTTMNGFSNLYWGWGRETNDIWLRTVIANFTITRPNGKVVFYLELSHDRGDPNEERFELFGNGGQRMHRDGINSLRYHEPLRILHPLYTNISVDIKTDFKS